jgi:hypothetical protein
MTTSEPRIMHQTEPVQVWADVDVGISAFVRYLNTIPGVRTHASCQGTIGEGGPEPYGPQVMVSWWTDDARKALEQLGLTIEGECYGLVYPRESSI